MKYVRRLTATSNDDMSLVVYLDQTNGNDSTAAIDDSTKPAKTLQAAITLASGANAPCEVRIVSDYVVDENETISKTGSNKVMVTCVNDENITATITGLAATDTTELEPHIIKDNTTLKELAASCNVFDVEHYLDFAVKEVNNQQRDELGICTQDIVMDVPSGYTVTAGMLIDVQTGWVNAHGEITDVSNGEMIVYLTSGTYAITTSSTGKYRLENYGNDINAFKFTKSGSIYQISGDTTGVKTQQSSLLNLLEVFNLVFKDCKFECVGNGTRGMSVFNAYAVRFEGCSFEYCSEIYMEASEDITFNNCYLHCTNVTMYTPNSYVRNSLFKTSYLFAVYGLTVERNEFCYSLKAIGGGIDRKSATSDKVQYRIVIQNNEIHHIGMLMQGDYGAVYRLGQGEAVIQYNYIHDCIGRTTDGSITGIYCDEAAYGILARYNLVVNCTSSTYTHYARGNVFYNNLFAYPVTSHIRYANKACYEGGTSYIANIFHEGDINADALARLVKDCAMFQYNVLEKKLDIDESFYVHSNEVGTIPFEDAPAADFAINEHQYRISKISMGSSNVRHNNQSMIDTTFFEKVTSKGSLKIPYGIPADSQWKSYETLTVDFTEDYDTWFIMQEMDMFNVTNEYLENLIN